MSLAPLISIHVAKAGGSSTARLLSKAYGVSLLLDYEDNPANPLSQRMLDPQRYFARKERLSPGLSCIHGHFHPGKFELSPEVVLFTLLRHPVDNILSIYFFWKSLKIESDPLLDYVRLHKLTIVEVAQLPILRWLFSRTYFEDFDMGRFYCVGRHEDREVAFRKLSERIGLSLDYSVRENITPESEERKEAFEDLTLRARLEDILVDDIRFYERHAR